MFETLSDRFEGIFKRLRGQGRLSEAEVDEVLREIRVALLEADVNVGVVRHVLRKHVERDLERLRVIAPGLVAATGVPSGASVPEPALI